MAGWDTLRHLVDCEFTQSIEEGRDRSAVMALRPAFEAAGDDEARLLSLWNQILALPLRADFAFNEPSDLPGIRALRAAGPRRMDLKLDDAALLDRMYGAWLGRCAGCALGKPVEGMMGYSAGENPLPSKERIKTYLTAIDPSEYPLRDYIPQHSPAEARTGRAGCKPSTREHIAFMESDDDIRYTVLGQVVMRDHGPTFTSNDVMRVWLLYLPARLVCTAETQAYRNYIHRYSFHMHSAQDAVIDWNWVANHQNPYREWIGAQIRADSWGYAAPGHPQLAAEFAWRDARMSHIKNGIYGEMFCAAMIAAAFTLDDPLAIIQAGLAEIPRTSRLHAEMLQVIDICNKHHCRADRFEAVLDDIYALLGHYHAVHTNNNAGLVVAALLLAGHDFEKAITIAVMGGWDTDCNGATVGSIVGAMLGAKRLPAKWTAPLHDTLYSLIDGYHPIAISQCASLSVEIARKVAQATP